MRTTILFGFGVLWAGMPVHATIPATTDPLPKGQPVLARAMGIEQILLGGDYSGTVTALPDGAITIAYQGGVIEHFNPAGQKVRHEVIPPQPPRTFPVSKTLADGGFGGTRGASYSYRLSDVRIDDRVTITCLRNNLQDICTSIRIERRPGGQVPQVNGPEYVGPVKSIRWHERCNAEQFVEERLLPMIPWFLGLQPSR